MSVTPTKVDYDRLDVRAMLAADEQTCFAFTRILRVKAKDAATSGDETGAAILSLLEDMCSFALRTDDRRAPFGPRVRFTDGTRTASVEDLSDAHVSLLEGVCETAAPAELRARMSDVLFVRRKHNRFGKLALDAYLEAARALLTSSGWVEASQRYQRALSLATLIRSERERVAGELLSEMEGRRPDTSYFSAKLMEALLDARGGEPLKMASLAEDAAAQAQTDGDWDRAREYLLLASQWHTRASDPTAALRARRDAAECYVKMADAGGSRSLEVGYLERAIQSLRTVPGTQSRVEELRRRLLTSGPAAVAEFKEWSTPVNFAEPAKIARARVSGRSLNDAIVMLALVNWPSSVQSLRESVVDAVRKAPFFNGMARTKLNKLGKVVAKRGSLLGGTPEEQEEALRQAMFEQASEYRQGVAVGAINPARSMVTEEHSVGVREILPLVSASAFVPAGREEPFAVGLAAGFDGDFAVSLHLLMPQFEHSVRSILDARGALTSKIDEDGIQDEKDLGALLYLPEAATVFDADILFEMQGLLVERCGSNLRNLMAHGLLDTSDCVGPQSVYFWWLTLHLVVRPLVARTPQATGAPAEPAAPPDDKA